MSTGLTETIEAYVKQLRSPTLFRSSGAKKLVVKKLTYDYPVLSNYLLFYVCVCNYYQVFNYMSK